MTAPAQASGAYDAVPRALFGLALALAAAGVVAAGRAPSRAIGAAAAALLALGTWAAVSPVWGGLPDLGWESLGHCATAAGALVIGNAAARDRTARAGLLGGLLLGIVCQAVEALVVVATGNAPADWFLSRAFEGPLGYHNAEGAFLALGLPLAVRFACSDSTAVRALAAAALPLLVGALMLTQSRGSVGVAIVALALQLALSRTIRAALGVVVAGAAAALLFPQLRHVDAALTTGGSPDGAGSRYAAIAALAALAAAVAAAFAVRDRRLPAPALAGIAAVATVGVLAVAHEHIGAAADRLARGALTDMDPGLAAPGETRLVTLSLDGRRDAWRVAWNATRERPLVGSGIGTFARRWTVERRLDALYILQPHSLELELLSELGVVGAALLLAFVGAGVVGLARGPDRLSAAAAGAVLVTFVGEASVDWTWSFPVVLATACAVVGAAAGPAAAQLPVRPAAASACAACVLAVLLFGPRVVAADAVDKARSLATSAPASAGARLDLARVLDPWDPDAAAETGRLAEARGDYREAARLYARAAVLSQRPWLQHFRQARALAAAGAARASFAACRAAFRENPGEPDLHGGPCVGVR